MVQRASKLSAKIWAWVGSTKLRVRVRGSWMVCGWEVLERHLYFSSEQDIKIVCCCWQKSLRTATPRTVGFQKSTCYLEMSCVLHSFLQSNVTFISLVCMRCCTCTGFLFFSQLSQNWLNPYPNSLYVCWKLFYQILYRTDSSTTDPGKKRIQYG